MANLFDYLCCVHMHDLPWGSISGVDLTILDLCCDSTHPGSKGNHGNGQVVHFE